MLVTLTPQSRKQSVTVCTLPRQGSRASSILVVSAPQNFCGSRTASSFRRAPLLQSGGAGSKASAVHANQGVMRL